MRIAIIGVRHKEDRKSPLVAELIGLLSEKGASVDMLYPEDDLIDLARVRVAYDLYVYKSGTETAFALAGILNAAGAQILNPYSVVAAMKDKFIASKILEAARIPLPEAYMAAEAGQLAGLLDGGALVVKPFWGSQGRGVQVIRNLEELDRIETGQGPIFAQRYHEPDGRDRKIYCIGGKLFGVMRIFPARTYEEKLGEVFTLTDEMRDITERAGRAFGIDLFGLDIILSDGRPYVVDINTFPGFKGVPEAARLLADYIYGAATRALKGEPLIEGWE